MHQHAAQIDRRGFISGAAAATALVAAAPLASKAHADEAGRPASMEVYIIDNGEMTLPDSQMYQGGDGSLTTFPMYIGIGHSFGMLGLMVKLPETGNVLMPSDACCYLANLDKENRLLPPERVTDYESTVATFDVISDLAEQNNAQVWPAHDPEWFSTMTLATEGCYA